MRRLGLLMTPEAHQLHHDSLRRDFSTNCGWSNPLLNPVFHWLHNKGYMRDEGLEPQSTKIFDEARNAGEQTPDDERAGIDSHVTFRKDFGTLPPFNGCATFWKKS